MARPLARTAGLVLAVAVAGTALAGCDSSSNDSTPGPTSSASSRPAVPSGYPSAAASLGPAVTSQLTAPGKALKVGETATVAWQPVQTITGALGLTVTGMARTSFDQSFQGWELDDAAKSNAPYFVTAAVSNAGPTDLGGRAVPLYGLAASGALVEPSTFASDFKPCGPSVLPTPFPAGASAQVCLVFLVPNGGALDGVSFRPTQSFDPITWSGLVTPLAAPSSKPKPKKSATSSSSPTSSPS